MMHLETVRHECAVEGSFFWRAYWGPGQADNPRPRMRWKQLANLWTISGGFVNFREVSLSFCHVISSSNMLLHICGSLCGVPLCLSIPTLPSAGDEKLYRSPPKL